MWSQSLHEEFFLASAREFERENFSIYQTGQLENSFEKFEKKSAEITVLTTQQLTQALSLRQPINDNLPWIFVSRETNTTKELFQLSDSYHQSEFRWEKTRNDFTQPLALKVLEKWLITRWNANQWSIVLIQRRSALSTNQSGFLICHSRHWNVCEFTYWRGLVS